MLTGTKYWYNCAFVHKQQNNETLLCIIITTSKMDGTFSQGCKLIKIKRFSPFSHQQWWPSCWIYDSSPSPPRWKRHRSSPRLILERVENAPIQSPADSWNDAKVVKFPDTRGPFSCLITENPRQMPRYVLAGGVRGFTLTGA